MSDLDRFRDHARAMARAEHRAGCRAQRPAMTCPTPDVAHPRHGVSRWVDCPGWCPSCVTDAERELWGQLADEIDAYLAPPDDGPGLFDDPGSAA